MSKFDLKEHSAHVRKKTEIRCSFAAKLQDIDQEATEYKALIESSVEEMESARKNAKLSRSQDTNRVVKAALEGGHHLLACILRSIFPINMFSLERRKLGMNLNSRDGGLSDATQPRSYGSSIMI